MNNTQTIVISIAILIGAVFGFHSCTTAVVNSDKQHTEQQRQCVEAGGSFYPSTGRSGSYVCSLDGGLER